MKIAYLDCFSGISGDMFLGALIDCGLPRKLLKKGLDGLSLGAYKMKITLEQRMHITGCRVDVSVPHKTHQHRNFATIKKIITDSGLNQRVKEISIHAFQRLASAESSIHHKKASEVCFHEVGAVDSIIDIVGTAIGIDYLELDDIYASPIQLGSGFTTCQHGVIPLPAPATVELLKGVPVCGTSMKTELVTPTGAALLTSLTNHYGPVPPMMITKVGYGVGCKQLKDRPNLLRLLVGTCANDQEADQVVIMEANIDDMIPEIYDYLMERLFEKGALDVSFSPIQMKKNRPGVLMRVICHPEKKSALTTVIFHESTSAGIRYYQANRIKLPRERIMVDTPYGKLSANVFKDAEGEYYASPEYEHCKKIAKQKGIPLKRVYLEISKRLPPLDTKFRLKKKKNAP